MEAARSRRAEGRSHERRWRVVKGKEERHVTCGRKLEEESCHVMGVEETGRMSHVIGCF